MSNYEKWVNYYYRKIRPFIPRLIQEMKKQNLDKSQAVSIMNGVFNRAIEEISRRFN